MSKEDKKTEDGGAREWFVKINEGDIYGPVDLVTLQQWSEQGRIEPENEISEDQKTWIAAEELPELEMDWMTELEDESIFGPFNIQLATELLNRGVISESTIIKNRKTGEIHPMTSANDNTPTINLEPNPPEVDNMQQENETEFASTTNPSPFADPRLPHDKQSNPEENKSSKPVSLTEETINLSPHQASNPLPEGPAVTDTTQSTSNTLRKELTKERAKATVLQDDVLRVQNDLKNSQDEKESANNQLVEAQASLAESESEVENLNAQLNQLQEHYERLQEESKDQFETLDQLRAETMELEKAYKQKVMSEAERASAKTTILAKTLRLIYQDKDLKNGDIPTELETKPDQTKELHMRISSLQDQIEDERKHASQIDQLLKKSTSNRPTNIVVIFLLSIVLVLVVTLAFAIKHQEPKTRDQRPETTDQKPTDKLPAPQSQAPVTNNQKPVTKNSEPRTKNPEPTPSPSNLDLPPENISKRSNVVKKEINWPTLNMPRCKISYGSKSCKIVFTYGIFSKSTTITPEAKLDLAKLAKQLSGQIKDFTLIVEGHTDSTPISSPIAKHIDNYALGRDRAETVKTFLETKCNIPKDTIRTASAGESDPPYLNDTPASRRKNRTVVITLIPPPK